ncbi:hypothetical protein ANN_06288 [Periplaneta americana]|uniref:Uncharacterized protein n=1 Tax=Periplaneta americana TaxID=6978 RepID=A0ABQ8TER0_PERAM|nr:hypothetical protein ANN_06288 [Periplaneta americana]
MAGLCEGGDEPPGSLKAIMRDQENVVHEDRNRQRNPVAKVSYNGWDDHCANHTIPPFWLDDRTALLRHVDVRPAAGWSV